MSNPFSDPTSPQEFNSNLHWAKIGKLDGKRLPELFDPICLLRGLVITSDIPEDVKARLKGAVYPLKAKMGSVVEKILKEKQDSKDVLILLVQDSEQEEGWICSHVPTSYIFEDPETLRELESSSVIGSPAYCFARCARLAITNEGVPLVSSIGIE